MTTSIRLTKQSSSKYKEVESTRLNDIYTRYVGWEAAECKAWHGGNWGWDTIWFAIVVKRKSSRCWVGCWGTHKEWRKRWSTCECWWFRTIIITSNGQFNAKAYILISGHEWGRERVSTWTQLFFTTLSRFFQWSFILYPRVIYSMAINTCSL